MEAYVITKIVEYWLHLWCFIICAIVNDNDSTIWAVLKYLEIGAWEQLMNSSKVKPDEKIPLLYFLADSIHWVKVFYNYIYVIANYIKYYHCKCTK